MAGDLDAIPQELAEQLAASGGNLTCMECGFSELIRPVRDQGAMSRTRDWIFRDAFRWREEAGDKIAIGPRRGRDYGEAVHVFESFHIGLERADLFLRIVTDQIVARPEYLDRRGSQRVDQFWMNVHFPRRTGGEIHCQAIAFPRDDQFAGLRVEAQGLSGLVELAEEDVSRCESRVPAEFHFTDGRKPSQLKTAIIRNKKGGFGEIVFCGDGL